MPGSDCTSDGHCPLRPGPTSATSPRSETDFRASLAVLQLDHKPLFIPACGELYGLGSLFLGQIGSSAFKLNVLTTPQTIVLLNRRF